MKATAEPVEGNKVRLSIEIEADEVDRVLDDAVRTLGRQARIPGFRPGKVPRQVLEARMGGRAALRAEALREALPDFYAQAVVDAEVDPIAAPEIDITSGQESGPLQFDALVEVRPQVSVPGYQGLRVTVPSPAVTDADVDAQIDRLRENDAELVTVERAAMKGDYVTIDLHGTAGGEEVTGADDFLYEVGSGTVTEELDAKLMGAKVGEILAFEATPEGAPTVSFRVLVKEVKDKHLPDVTDEWAGENSEFDTVAELRHDLETRIGRVKVVQAQLALRENTLSELVALVDDDEVPEVLVTDEVSQRLHDLSHRLEEQRLSLEQFLSATGRAPDELLGELRGQAVRAVKIDLGLRAVADAEGLVVTEEELDAEVEATAERMGLAPESLRHDLDHAGRTGAVRSEQRKAKALSWLLDHVELVDEEGGPVAREDLRVDQGVEEEGSDGTTGQGDPGSSEMSAAGSDPAEPVETVTPTEETGDDQ
ncbi:MAG TPA: trigger factor [Acidimicrobiales bacterium]|nr:trigger factor [Acidimicrobiales bacterium]